MKTEYYLCMCGLLRSIIRMGFASYLAKGLCSSDSLIIFIIIIMLSCGLIKIASLASNPDMLVLFMLPSFVLSNVTPVSAEVRLF